MFSANLKAHFFGLVFTLDILRLVYRITQVDSQIWVSDILKCISWMKNINFADICKFVLSMLVYNDLISVWIIAWIQNITEKVLW